MPEQPDVMSRREAAERLRVSVMTVRRWGASGILDERRVGPKMIRITTASVERALRGGKESAA